MLKVERRSAASAETACGIMPSQQVFLNAKAFIKLKTQKHQKITIHNSELSEAHKVSLRGAAVAAVVMHMLRFLDFHRR